MRQKVEMASWIILEAMEGKGSVIRFYNRDEIMNYDTDDVEDLPEGWTLHQRFEVQKHRVCSTMEMAIEREPMLNGKKYAIYIAVCSNQDGVLHLLLEGSYWVSEDESFQMSCLLGVFNQVPLALRQWYEEHLRVETHRLRKLADELERKHTLRFG